MEKTLDVEVREMLRARRGDWQAIAKDSKVSYSWLSKFFNGHIDNPGYATLLRLREHLAASRPATAKAA